MSIYRTDDPIVCSRQKVRADYVGKIFGRLTVVEYSHTKGGKAFWHCICSCGNEVVVPTGHLSNGHTKSCGCYKNELIGNRNKSHGMRHTRIYRIWLNMKNRCNNPRDDTYKHYGDRGVTVCEE